MFPVGVLNNYMKASAVHHDELLYMYSWLRPWARAYRLAESAWEAPGVS